MKDGLADTHLVHGRPRDPARLLATAIAVLAAGLAYPWILDLSSALARHAHGTGACLLAATLPFLAPVLGFGCFLRLASDPSPAVIAHRTKRTAVALVVAPSFYVLSGVVIGNWNLPISDRQVWLIAWTGLALFVLSGRPSIAMPDELVSPNGGLRVIHGCFAAALLVFVAFHLGNHLAGLAGPETHAVVMRIGRTVYRSGPGEVVLLGLLATQLVTGAMLARRWLLGPCDGFRAAQTISGIAVGAYIVTHANSALVSARLVNGIETDWAWASGAPEGLLGDDWNIRLLPHYGIGVFMIGLHLALGLRTVMLAHKVAPQAANRICWVLTCVTALLAIAILAALLGGRL